MLVDAAAAECPRVDLDDALGICLVYLAADPERYRRAAARWLARLINESSLTIGEAGVIAAALTGMAAAPAEERPRRHLAALLLALDEDRAALALSREEPEAAAGQDSSRLTPGLP